MTPLFDRLTRLSIQSKWITIVLTVALMLLGVFAALNLTIELLPPIDIPSTFVLARSHGATNGDLMLQAYTVPIETGTAQIDGVVNRESNTSNGFAFLEIRNEFGLDQTRIRADIQTVLSDLALPLRTIQPPAGSTATSMIADLTPDVVLYLYAYSLEENVAFLPPLDPAVWRSFSPDVLGALPDTVFDELDPMLAGDLRARRTGRPQTLPDYEQTDAPPLPASWQMDRFETADDLIELVEVRSLAGIFNDFLENGTITGPLGTTDDLTPADLQHILALESACRAAEDGSNSLPSDEAGEDTCSLLASLDGEAIAALLTHYAAGANGQLTESLTLPDGYFAQLDQEDRNQIAATLIAQRLTDTRVARSVELPDEWKFEPPQLITFSLSDIPLAVISVSADIPRGDLQHLVENEIVPRLEALDPVADVSIEGGEEIRADLLNTALEAEGLDAETAETAADGSTGTAPESPDSENTSPNANTDGTTTEPNPAIEEGPELPTSWQLFGAQIPGIEEFDSADDLLRLPTPPSALLNQALAMSASDPISAQFIKLAFNELTPEILEYLAAHEDGFYDHLSDDVTALLPAATLADLPEEVQARLNAPTLGEFWQRMAAEPEFESVTLHRAIDLLALKDGVAATINQIALDTPDAILFYAVQLINDLSPDVIAYVAAKEDEFVDTLDPRVFCLMSAEALNEDSLRARWSEETWTCPRPDGTEVALAKIADGTQPTAAETLLGSEDTTRIHDPEAPALPPSWPGIAGFVGAKELDTADDLFYTVENGEVRAPSGRLNDFTRPDGQRYARELTPDVLQYIAACDWGELCEEGFYDKLSDQFLALLPDETAAALPESVQTRREAALRGIYVPENIVTRTNGNPSLIVNLRKEAGANTVAAWDEVDDVLRDMEQAHPEIEFAVAFEQATYIEESISGVAREGGLGAVMAVVVILIFLNFSVRSTLVTGISIPTSVALAFVLMKWLPGNVYDVLYPLSEDATGATKSFLAFMLRLFPENISLNIMTLSGLTVAIGRVVDDAIVVLENIYRNIQRGEDQLEAVLHGTRDVSVAIFAATVTTVIVFLPIGLFGGIIGAFFLPFGLAVTYALAASFVVAITVVPLFAYLFIDKDSLPDDDASRMERGYRGLIQWVLDHRWVTMGIATLAFMAGVAILGQLPTAFLPDFGDPTITVSVDLPGSIDGQPTTIAVTDAKVRRLESYLATLDGIETIQTSVGGGGNALGGSNTVSESEATITIAVKSQDALDDLTPLVRAEAEAVFNDLDRDGMIDADQSNVTVSGASLSEQGFGGFAVVVSGDEDNPPTLAELQQYDPLIVSTLEGMNGITNVESSLSQITGMPGAADQTYIRIDGIPAVRYTAELETEDTLGLTQEAIAAVKKVDLPDNLTVGEGFESQQQTEGFQQMFVSMGIAVVIVYVVMVLTFGSLVHPITILFSLPLAVVGAAIGLAVTGRVLGLSSVVGLLMLVGIVVTNAIVLIARVQTNRKERGMDTRTALVDGGATRLRPILMTAIATMVALTPLAIGLSEGAIIASELGTVVIGGLFSSTLLTLVVVPVVYSLFDQAQAAVKTRLMNSRANKDSSG